ncbi:MAG TPA: hypothetical protein VFV94_12855, partial [Polyangiaceae bacterium]|nr:hypothetical protein [Polyangiaceae bacterium]
FSPSMRSAALRSRPIGGRFWLFLGLVSASALGVACGSGGDAGSHGGTAAKAGTLGEAGDQGSGGTTGSGATSGSSGKSGSSGSTGAGGSGTSAGGDGSTDTGGTTSSGGDAATGGSTASGGSSATAGSGATAGTDTTVTTACDNGLDDDGDGLVDGLDPECTGAFDQDEGTYATGVPGDNKDPKWQDCFFDGNSGGGDDGCRYSTSCLTGDLAADDPACELAQNCIDYCARLTPNGCDCFGCCTVQDADGTNVDIFTTSTCSLDKLDDEDACPRCQKSIACDNPCGECELCPGKTEADLPDSCEPPPPTGSGGTGGTGAGGSSGTGGSPSTGGTGGTDVPPPPRYTCDGGQQVCGTELPSCGPGMYCQLGCCMPSVR